MSRASPGRRRLESSRPTAYEVVTRQPRISSRRASVGMQIAVLVLWLAATSVAASSVVAVGIPSSWWRPSAAVLLVAFTIGLTHRAGGRMRIWIPLALLLAGAAVATERSWLLAASATVTAVLASVLAVIMTRPAKTLRGSLLEFAVALVIAMSGTFAVAAWNAPVRVNLFTATVMVGSLLLALSIIWSVGAGLHGVSRVNLIVLIVIAVVTAILFFYSGFVRNYGSPALKAFITESIFWLRHSIGGVPRPFEALIGFPALIVGVSLRSRYRQGWWVCVFAVVGTMTVVVSLVDPGAYPSYFLFSTLYSALIGIVLGLLARWVVLRGSNRRSARAVEQPHRTEPARHAPLR